MATWLEWLRDIGKIERETNASERARAIETFVKTSRAKLQADLERTVGAEQQEEKHKLIQHLIWAEDLYKALAKDGLRVPKPMVKYTSQLIILLDDDLEDTAKDLQRKRDTAGDGHKSHIWNWAQKRFDPPLEAGAARPSLTPDSRVYVVAHGAPDSESLVKNPMEPVAWLTPAEIVTELKKCFTELGVPRVKRMTLVICFSAGNSTGRDNGGELVQATASLAHKVFDGLFPTVTEVSGYSEGVVTKPRGDKIEGKNAYSSISKVTGLGQNEYKQPNRKVTFYKDKANVTQSRGEYLPPPAAAGAKP